MSADELARLRASRDRLAETVAEQAATICQQAGAITALENLLAEYRAAPKLEDER